MWRALFLVFLLTATLLPAMPALAQMWPNETGPGGDILSGSGRQFDRLRQAAPAAPAPAYDAPFGAGFASLGGGIPPGRASIPLLDWTPPPLPAATPAPRRSPPRPAASQPAPSPAAQPAAASQNWERSLAERERELEALRRRLEEDRRRYEAQRPGAAPAALRGPAAQGNASQGSVPQAPAVPAPGLRQP